MLQNAGGPLSRAAMLNRLRTSTFRHDLDPDHAQGSAGGLTVRAVGGSGDERSTPPGGITDPRVLHRALPRVLAADLDRVQRRHGQRDRPGGRAGGRAASLFDPRPFGGSEPFQHVGFRFVVSSATGGLEASDVSAVFSRPGGVEPGTFRTMTLQFAGRGLRTGQSLQFGIDRDERTSGYGGSAEGNGADILADQVDHPSGRVLRSGLTFTGHRADGRTFTGRLRNRIGFGFSVADGYGVIDAQEAVGR